MPNNYNNIFNNLRIIRAGFSANRAGFAGQDAPQTLRSSNHTKAEAMLTVQSSYVGGNQLVKGRGDGNHWCSPCLFLILSRSCSGAINKSCRVVILPPLFPPCTHEQQQNTDHEEGRRHHWKLADAGDNVCLIID